MFSSLKPGSNLWILHASSATPFVEIGTVDTANNVMPTMFYPNLPAYPMDITVKVGEKNIPLRGLPPNAESASVTDQTSGESVVIACSKEAIINEVDTQVQKSLEVVNSVEFHKNRIAVFGDLKKQLNPELAEKEAQAKELAALREELKFMREKFAELKGETSS